MHLRDKRTESGSVCTTKPSTPAHHHIQSAPPKQKQKRKRRGENLVLNFTGLCMHGWVHGWGLKTGCCTGDGSYDEISSWLAFTFFFKNQDISLVIRYDTNTIHILCTGEGADETEKQPGHVHKSVERKHSTIHNQNVTLPTTRNTLFLDVYIFKCAFVYSLWPHFKR